VRGVSGGLRRRDLPGCASANSARLVVRTSHRSTCECDVLNAPMVELYSQLLNEFEDESALAKLNAAKDIDLL
jgi:hypothetical protein